MRPLVLLLCSTAALIGLPMLADQFRAGPPRALRTADLSKSPDKTGAAAPATLKNAAAEQKVNERSEQRPGTASAPTGPLPVKLSDAAAVLPVPNTRAELIEAIGKELSRLGLYQGPISKAWTKTMRTAVRRFNGAKAPQPTSALLSALQAVKRDEKSVNAPPSINAQTVAITVAKIADARTSDDIAAGSHLRSGDYPPPSAGIRTRSGQASRGPALTQRGRASKKERPASAARTKRASIPRASRPVPKTKSMFANASFSWPGL